MVGEKRQTTATKSTEQARKVPGLLKKQLADARRAREEGRSVAYVLPSGGFDEILRAMDIAYINTEAFASLCAVKRDAERFVMKAESEGFSRTLCGYAVCSLGFDILREELGETPPDAPWGGMVRPDMMLSSTGTGQCEPRAKWYQAAQHYMPDVPVYQIDTPFPTFQHDAREWKEAQDYYVKYTVAELKRMVELLEQHTGRKMDWDRLSEITDLFDRTWDKCWDVHELRKAVPTPMGTEDAIIMISVRAGERDAYDFWSNLYDELKSRIDNQTGVVGVAREKYRLLWGAGIPPWFALNIFDYFKRKGAVFPVETTYRVEAVRNLDLPEVSNPLEHIAWRWLKMWTYWHEKARKRAGSHPRVERLIKYIEDYKIDGVVMHQVLSCRSQHADLKWQLNLLKKVYGDIPTLLIESDMIDLSAYSEAEWKNQIDTFIEVVGVSKNW